MSGLTGKKAAFNTNEDGLAELLRRVLLRQRVEVVVVRWGGIF